MQVPEETRGIGSLELEVEMVVNCLTWVLRTKLESFGRAASALHD